MSDGGKAAAWRPPRDETRWQSFAMISGAQARLITLGLTSCFVRAHMGALARVGTRVAPACQTSSYAQWNASMRIACRTGVRDLLQSSPKGIAGAFPRGSRRPRPCIRATHCGARATGVPITAMGSICNELGHKRPNVPSEKAEPSEQRRDGFTFPSQTKLTRFASSLQPMPVETRLSSR